MNEIISITANENGTAVVSSREVAEHFGKQHKDVLESIKNLAAENSAAKSMFYETTFDNRGKQYPMYLMNRDGFSLMAMGFTGKEALTWKLKYIEAFNRMEQDWNSPEKVMARALKIADETILSLNAKTLQLEQRVSEYEPKIQYLDKILQSNGTLTVTQIAADYGLSANRLNKILREEHIQHNVGGQWILYKEHMNKSYTKSETIHFQHSDGTPDTNMFTRWTQKGRLLIHGILERRGIKANMDRAVA